MACVAGPWNGGDEAQTHLGLKAMIYGSFVPRQVCTHRSSVLAHADMAQLARKVTNCRPRSVTRS